MSEGTRVMRRFVILAGAVIGALLFAWLTVWTFAEARAHDYMMVGIVVAEDNVALEVEMNQMGATDEVVVSRVLAPDDSWLVVHLEGDDDMMMGKRIGIAQVPPGESRDVTVTLDEPATTPKLIVVLHADRGQRGVFEFSMDRFMASPDKPYFVGFEEVMAMVERD